MQPLGGPGPQVYGGGYYQPQPAGDGTIIYKYFDAAAVQATFFEARTSTGEVSRYQKTVDVNGLRHYRLAEFIDSHDNSTLYEYDSSYRLLAVHRPDGVTEQWNYSPSWIAGWNSQGGGAQFSGVEVTYWDNATSQAIPAAAYFMVFHATGAGPFLGDTLYRVYHSKTTRISESVSPGTEEYGASPSVADVHPVYQYEYTGGLISQISYLTASGIYAGSAESSPEPIALYDYVAAGDRDRVWHEVQPMLGQARTYAYAADPYEASRVDYTWMTDAATGVVVQTQFDDAQRPTQVVTTPPDNSEGRPRASDPDGGTGYSEPLAITVNYEYGACGGCVTRPTRVSELPSGRETEVDYDPISGLITQVREMNPSGKVAKATTTYSWSPLVVGDIYGTYKLDSITYPDEQVWHMSYTDAVRPTPSGQLSRGKKLSSQTLISPAVAGGAALQSSTTWDASSPVLSAQGRPLGLVGFVTEATDQDAIKTSYTRNALGFITSVCLNSSGQAAEQLVTAFAPNRAGMPTQVVRNYGSALSQTITCVYNADGTLASVATSAQGQPIESRSFYDVWGNLAVSLRTNATSSGGTPDDFGASPRPDVARPWTRDEFHYSGPRLLAKLQDRRALDRNDQGPLSDDPDARFLLTTFVWTPNGLLAAVGLPNGSATEYTYDGYGSLYKSEVVGGAATLLQGKYFVNDALEVTRFVDGLGHRWEISRNSAGYVTRTEEPATAVLPDGYSWATSGRSAREFAYDDVGREVESRVLDMHGAGGAELLSKTVTRFDEVGRVYQVETYQGTGPTPLTVSTAAWEGGSKVVRVTDAAGRFVERVYDGLSRVIETRDCTPGQPSEKEVFEYSPNSENLHRRRRLMLDPLGQGGAYTEIPTEYVYNELGQVLQAKVGPAGSELVSAFSYYTTGQTASYTDPSGKVERYLPDAQGRLIERFLSGTSPIWNGTTYKDWVASGGASELLQTDGLGHTTRTVFDFAGRPTVVMEPGATVMPTTASPHHAFARLMSYDAASRLATVYASEDIEIAMHRDSAGRLLQRRRVVDINTINNSVVSWLWKFDNLRYDALGQVIETNSFTLIDDEYIHETIGRDVIGRTLSESYDFIGSVGGPEIVSGFVGGDSFRSTVGIVNGGFPEDLHVRYAPDATGRVAGIEWQVNANGWKPLASYQHEGQSIRRRSMSLALGVPPGGQVPQFDTTYSYDAYGRMSKIEQSFSSAASVDFYFDAASNLVKEVYGKKSGATGDRFAYDEHHRLQTAWMDSNQAHLPTQDSNETFIKKLTYGLDAVHNRTTVAEQAGQGGGTTTTPYSLDSLSNRYGSVGGSTLIYDARGNLTFDGVSYYIYDAMNRLTEVYKLEVVGQSGSMASMQSGASSATSEKSFAVHDQSALEFARRQITQRLASQANVVQQAANPALVPARTEHLGLNTVTVMEDGGPTEEEAQMVLKAWYLYDAFNRRVTRWVGDDGVYFYAWDGWQEAQETIYRDQGGSYSGEVKQFVWGEQLDELVSYRRSTDFGLTWSNYYIAEGGAHCPVRVLNEAAAVVEEQEYDPYGRVTYYANGVASAVSQIGNAFAWRGLPVDHETGLVYSRNRYLNVELGRFMSQDPLGAWGDPGSRGSAYTYGSNAPLTHGDPFGLQEVLASQLHQMWGVVERPMPRTEGLVRALGALGEGAGSVALLPCPGGTPVGVAGLAHAFDNLAAGVWQLVTGERTDPLCVQGMQALGVPPGVANIANDGIGLGVTLYAGGRVGSTMPGEGAQLRTGQSARIIGVGELSVAGEGPVARPWDGTGGIAITDTFILDAFGVKDGRSVANRWLRGLATEGTYRDPAGKLRNANGTFAYDGGPKGRTGGTHGNTAGAQEAFLYERFDADGNFLKHGVTQDLSTRYTLSELDGGYLISTQRGPRSEMLKVERNLVETNPGPLNREPWAGKRKQ
ncbi:MAG: hypothetical protein K8J09_23695 [Planctomycetes bacterium]|nr:hypothetical protein [Planctomycetota bacterium]